MLSPFSHPFSQTWSNNGALKARSSEAADDVRHKGHHTFTQLIDHSNPGLGTFEQWYGYSTKNSRCPHRGCSSMRNEEQCTRLTGSVSESRKQ